MAFTGGSGSIWGRLAALARSIVPGADNTYDLGSSSKRWAGIYAVLAVITTLTVVNIAMTGNLDAGGGNITNISEINEIIFVEPDNWADLQAKWDGSTAASTIIIPEGTYLMNETLTLTTNQRGMTIKCASRWRTIFKADTGFTGDYMVNVTGIENVIENCMFNANYSVNNIFWVDGGMGSYNNLAFSNQNNSAVIVTGNSYYNTWYQPTSSQLADANGSITFDFLPTANENMIFGGRIDSDVGIKINDSQHIKIIGLAIEPVSTANYSAGVGIEIHGVANLEDIEISFNRFENTKQDIVVYSGVTSGDLTLYGNSYVSNSGYGNFNISGSEMIPNKFGPELSHPYLHEANRGGMLMSYDFERWSTHGSDFSGDGSTFENNLTRTNCVWQERGGRDNESAYYFDGASDIFEVEPTVGANTSEMTWRTIVRFDNNYTDAGMIFSQYRSGAIGFARASADVRTLDNDSNWGKLYWKLYNGTGTLGQLITENVFNETGVWYEIVGSWNGSHAKAYKNGEWLETNSLTLQGGLGSYINRTRLGSDPSDSGHYLNGTMSMFEIYDYALTDGEIAHLYEARVKPHKP